MKTLKGKNILKAAGVLAVAVGFLAAFLGFIVMSMNMLSVDLVLEEDVAQYMESSRKTNILGLYIMGFGVFSCITGFIGAVNSDNVEYIKKCFMYACAFIVLCILNVVIMAVLGNVISFLGIVLTGIPLLVALLYMTGVLLNKKSIY